MDFLKTRRVAVGKSQAEVASECGMRQSRLSEIECGLRVPTGAQAAKLCAALGLPAAYVLPDLPKKLQMQMRTAVSTVIVADDKEAWDRVERTYLAELDAFEMLSTTARLLRIDSALEGLALMQLISKGAKVFASNPQLLGFGPHSIIDENLCALGPRRLPCLTWRHGEWQFVIWPQVSVRAGTYVYRLDGLVLVRKNRRRFWAYYKIDGSGHNPAWDEARTKRLSLPNVRFTRQQVEGMNFADHFVAAYSRRFAG